MIAALRHLSLRAAYAATTSESANTSFCDPSVFVFDPGPHIKWKFPSESEIFPIGFRPSGKFSAIGMHEIFPDII